MQKKQKYSWITLVIILVIVGYFAYDWYQHKINNFIQYGYACPFEKNATDCHRVIVDIDDGYCGDQGGCTDRIIKGFSLNGKSYIKCSDSQRFNKKEYLCTDTKGKDWDIELSEVVKVKKPSEWIIKTYDPH